MKSDSLKTIFIHIPKCGGTSLENILFEYAERSPANFWMGGINKFQNRYFNEFSRIVFRNKKPIINKYQTGGLQHLTALQMRHALGRENFESYYRFAVVRHPLKRCLSQYHYIQKRRDLMNWIGMNSQDSFQVYLKKTYSRAHVQWQPQISFVNDYLGGRLVHDVIKLEELDVDMPKVFDRIGILPRDIPHLNKSAPSKKKYKFSTDEKAIVWELYKEDFEVFGYDIEES
jgi:hypothetical protein